MKVLVTGGAGYIGSTVCSALLDRGHVPIIMDSLVNGKIDFTKDRIFYKADIESRESLQKIFADHPDIEYVIHCAGYIYVPESVDNPFAYYYNNVVKSAFFYKNLCDFGCKKVIFSSTAALYGSTDGTMVSEDMPVNPDSPYGRTKLMVENILQDYSVAYGLKAISLRYFNPIGADPQMRTGSYVKNPSHILGSLLSTYSGDAPVFHICGVDWPTRDGSGIRDYLHVWDLADAHIKAIENFDSALEKSGEGTLFTKINLGTGNGVTVKEFVQIFEKVVGREISKVISPPRVGDVAGAYANAETALNLIGWSTKYTIEESIHDAIKWRESEKIEFV